VAGGEGRPGATNHEWMALRVDLTGGIDWEWTDDPSPGVDGILALDSTTGTDLVVAGVDSLPGKMEWRVVKLEEPSPPPPITRCTITAAPQMGQAPLTVVFGARIEGGTPSLVYSWEFGDGGTSNESAPRHTYTSEGTYKVILAVQDSAWSSANASATIEVSALSQPNPKPIPGFELPLLLASVFMAFMAVRACRLRPAGRGPS